MAYQKLKLDPTTPALVRYVITESIENLNFADVHTMLRLPLHNDDPTLDLGCGFAISHILLAIISGVSSTLYDCRPPKKGNREIGQKFQDLLVEFYPWKYESKNESEAGLKPLEGAAAAGVIYDVYRNPLTHSLGISEKARGRKIEIKRLEVNEKMGLREKEIEQLERRRPAITATVKMSADRVELFVEALYWGVRRMIEKLTKDRDRMKAAEKFLMYKAQPNTFQGAAFTFASSRIK